MYMDKPNGEPYPNPIKKFKLELNVIIVEPELKPKPCDLGREHYMFYNCHWVHVDHFIFSIFFFVRLK